jgi:glycine/D-amino acid oxidase-like deaminating enzyme
VLAETDVLVVGGGHAGLCAAAGAARAGARVFLVERWGFLGGSPTAGLMSPLMSFYRTMPSVRPPPPDALVPTKSGPAEPVVAGIFRELLDRLVAAGGAIEPSEETGHLTVFDAHVLRAVAFDLLDADGVDYLLYAQASGVEKDGDAVRGVVFDSKDGPFVIRAKAVVDATGDGDVAAFAGVPHSIGRPSDGLTEPVSLFFNVAGFDHATFSAYVRENPDDWHGGVQGLQKLIRQARDAGDLNPPGEHVMIFRTLHPEEVLIDFARVIDMRGANLFDMTRAEAESRRQLLEITAFLRKYVPGFRDAHATSAGATLVVRQFRRLEGVYTLTSKDVLGARKFADVVARGSYPIDVHQPDGKGTKLKPLPMGAAYDIPLRCLIPAKIDNLVLSGRCISGDTEAEGSYRINAICAATGHAAGVCAALSAATGRPPRAVAADAVQTELIRQKASLGDPAALSLLGRELA